MSNHSAVIFVNLIYIGNKPFKRDSYYNTGLTFVPFMPQPVDVVAAHRMANENPAVYMITSDPYQNPTIPYLELLVNRGMRELAEKEVENSTLNKSLDELLESAGVLVKHAEQLGGEVVEANAAALKQEETKRLLDERAAFSAKISKSASKAILVKMGQEMFSADLNPSAGRGELEEQLIALWEKQRGMTE